MEGTHFAVTEIPTAKYNDKYSSIYVAFVLCGIGFLLPYNTFVTAVDYYQAKHPATTIVYDVSMTYICVACVTVIVNNMLVGTVPLQTRITAGYMLSIATMALVTICDIGLELFPENISYRITLVSVAAVSVASTVQQSSFYGFASMLPSRYTQALMLGESTAGVFTSLNRVITKSLVSDLSASILVFFSFCLAAIVACCVVFQIIRQAEFVELHIGLCTADSGSGGQGGGGEGLAGIHHHAQTESAAVPALGGVEERPAEEVDMLEKSWNNSRTTEAGKTRHISNGTLGYHGDMYGSRRYLTEPDDVIDFNDVTVLQRQPSSSRRNTLCTKLAASISRRLDVTRRVWPYMLSITLAYLVTLMLYPGVVTEVTSCKFGSWMPVILIIAFNVSDFVCKLLAANRHEMRRHQLVALGLARFVLVPLLVLCTLPRASPRLSEEVWPIVFSIMLGVTNGYLGSVPIILAPKYVPNQYKELTGNMMTLFYNFGLTVGSALAYAIESKLGPHAELSVMCAQQAASISNMDNSDLQHSTTMRF